MDILIEVHNLSFSYTSKPYITDLSFSVGRGEVFGFLGPSGAGKSTLQKILTGILPNYHGTVRVGGTEVRKAKRDFYEGIGVDFEFPSLYKKLSARENLRFFGSLYRQSGDIDVLLAQVGLQFDADKPVEAYSKGMKSRLNFIKALVHDPQLLFLDEPTSGLDPSNARIMKDMIVAERNRGKTIILTTHNMNDAAELCDRVAFIVDGSIRALDTPRNLVMARGAQTIEYSYRKNGQEYQEFCALNRTADEALLLELLKSNGLSSIHSSEPSLNDIFIELTGRTLE
jgi:fluoroquinolone transport system ATP-binding protein